MSLSDVVSSIADIVSSRAAVGKNYGTVLIPEGLIAAIPELIMLNREIDLILSEKSVTSADVYDKLSVWNRALLTSLPSYIQEQLLSARSSIGSLQFSQV